MMDGDTRKKLEAARLRTPRFLFRCWNNDCTIAPASGGYVGLNTVRKIQPLAFFNGRGNADLYDITAEALAKMAVAHVRGWHQPETQLSSWAASPLAAIYYSNLARDVAGYKDSTHNRNIYDNVYLSIIDTQYPGSRNPTFHVPQLAFLSDKLRRYTHEYLMWGVVTEHRSMLLRDFFPHGMTPLSDWALEANPRPEECEEITASCVAEALAIGEKCGGRFALVMTLAVLCMKRRDPKYFRDGVPGMDAICAAIYDIGFPEDWKRDATIQDDVVYTKGFGEIEQFIRLLRAVSWSRGKRRGIEAVRMSREKGQSPL